MVFAIKTTFMQKILISLLIFAAGIQAALAWSPPPHTFVELPSGISGQYYFFEEKIEIDSNLDFKYGHAWWVYGHEYGHALFRDVSIYNYYGIPVPESIWPDCDSYITDMATYNVAEDVAESFAAFIHINDAFYREAKKDRCIALKYLAVKRRILEKLGNGN